MFLRLWEDELRILHGTRRALVYRHTGGSQSAGRKERLRQLDLVGDGAQCYLIFCTAADPSVRPRRIVGFNARTLSRGGGLIELDDGDVWIEVLKDVPLSDAMRQRPRLSSSSTDARIDVRQMRAPWTSDTRNPRRF